MERVEGVWPTSADDLAAHQTAVGALQPERWEPRELDWAAEVSWGGCFVCFGRGGSGPGRAGDHGWSAAVVLRGGRLAGEAVREGEAPAPYRAGFLALREGPLLAAAVRGLPQAPDVLLVNATGRDHPRRCGLAVQLGALLELPTVGVTHRPLLAAGAWPGEGWGETAALLIHGELVGYWVRTREGVRPLAAHAGWRTSPETAAAVVLATSPTHRTPDPLRHARRLAREARARAVGQGARGAGR